MNVRRGDIVIVDLNPTEGSEQRGTRPCLVVQNDVGNENAPTEGSEQRGTRPCLVVQNDVGNENAPTTIVVPFTTSRGEQLYPFEVLVSADECSLREDSVALCSQIRTVSIEHRITDNIGSIPDSRMEEVDDALEYSLGLKDL